MHRAAACFARYLFRYWQACKRKRVDVVELLLAAGTSPAAPSSHGGGAAGDSPHASGHPRVDVNASGPLFAAIAAEDEG